MTAPALATTPGSFFAVTGTNAIAQRTPLTNGVQTAETTTSTSFADLTTAGPSVTVTSGTTALIIVHSRITTSVTGAGGRVGYVISGASTIPPNNEFASCFEPAAAGQDWNGSAVFLQTGMTSGSNTVKMQYKVDAASTGTFSSRYLTVIPY